MPILKAWFRRFPIRFSIYTYLDQKRTDEMQFLEKMQAQCSQRDISFHFHARVWSDLAHVWKWVVQYQSGRTRCVYRRFLG